VATNLFTQLINDFKGDTLDRVSSAIGETPARTASALGDVMPALISGLASRTSTTDQANGLLDIIRRNNLDSDRFADTASALEAPGGITVLGDTGRVLMESLFGGRAGSLADWVTSRSGVSRSSSSSLLGLALPIVLGMIAKRMKSAGWSASNLMTLLGEERSSLPDMPGLANALNPDTARIETYGEGAYVSREGARVHATSVAHDRDTRPRRSHAWLWALPLLFLIPLFGYLMKGGEPQRVADTKPAPEIVIPKARIPEPLKPVGTSGVTSAAVRESGAYRIEFQTGLPMTAASENDLREVASILKANDGARADINGYTDSIGDANLNLKLSEERATAMMNELVSLGVDRSRMNARGFGEDHPVADNATAEGRQRNRRVEIHVTDR